MEEAEAAGDDALDSIRVMEAVAIDNLDRTRSSGYVEPVEVKGSRSIPGGQNK